jgi:hypothetical protein
MSRETTSPPAGQPVNVQAPAGVLVGAPRRPRKGHADARYRVTAKLSRCRVAAELLRGMPSVLRQRPWATGGDGR